MSVCLLTSLRLHLCRWPQFAREVDSMQAPQPQRLPQQRKRPPRGLNVPTAGRPTPAMVQPSNASSIAGTERMPPMQSKTARLRGDTWHRSTLLRSKTSSLTHSTQLKMSGLERWTLTITVRGNGRMGQALTSPTGFLASLTEGSTTYTWMMTILGHGGIWSTATATIICANLPCRYFE